MEFSDVTNYISQDNLNLKYLGLFVEDFSELRVWYKALWFILHVVFMGLYNTSLIINWMLNTNSLLSFIEIGYVILTCCMGQIKVLLLLSNKKHVSTLAEELKNEDFLPQNEEEWNMVNEELAFFKKAKKMLIVTSFLSMFSLIFTPLFDGSKYDGLPVPAWYGPINITLSPAYEIAYIHQSVSVLLVGLGYIYAEVMFSGVSTFTGLQCNILSSRLKKIVDKDRSDQQMQGILVKCVAHHWKIIRLVKTTENVFGRMYFWQLAACILTLCMDLFLISLANPSSFEFFYLVVYFTDISTLLLVPCWFASEVTRKSENIPISAYKCNWIETSDSFKKELIFFIQRSQRPLNYYAIDFFEISVQTFVKIIRTSLSYFAVLNSMKDT